ncbi:MAG: threonylcarbamoyl-AMP synthase [Dehalococcoidia bacterium]|nr:threonylcarbamoyl-AMP synthase [Dehalococcoidia bacterium]
MPAFPTDLERQIADAVGALRHGGVVAYPTDTLYGLGADIFNESAVERVFTIKGRPRGMPLPVLLADAEQLALVTDLVAGEVPPLARTLAQEFWPGALTLILPRSPHVPDLITGRGWKVGVRVPDHPVPRELIRRLGSPITGTSANRTGGPDPFTALEVRRQLGDEVDIVVEGGPPPAGHASTVLDLTGPSPRIVRVGAIPKQRLEAVCGTLL